MLITGASSGFGAAAARAFGAEGSRLLLGARRVERLDRVTAEALKAGAAEAHFHFLDVSKTSSVEEFVRWARDRIVQSPSSAVKSTPEDKKSKVQSPDTPAGGLHVLINNAGGALGLEPVAEGKDEDWETMMQTNVLGVLRMTRAALPLLRHNAGSSILNIGSYAGHAVYEGGAAYCGAKAAELQITRTLRLELSGTGIRVCSIDPGLAETEFSIVRFKGDSARAKKTYEGTQPLTAEDIAEILVWVASRPPHVNIDNMLIKCVDQAAMHKVFRRK